jgi:hypothetical protein
MYHLLWIIPVILFLAVVGYGISLMYKEEGRRFSIADLLELVIGLFTGLFN